MMRRGTAANEELVNRANYLLDGAAMIDSQLQAYRSFHLILQSAFMVVGGILSLAILLLNDLLKSGLAAGLLMAVAWISQQVANRLRMAILMSSEDVNYWHQKLICLENELPEVQRYFTEFKIEQKTRRSDSAYIDHLRQIFLQQRMIDDGDSYRLVERGSGHLRAVFEDELFRLIAILWRGFVGVSAGYMVYLLLHAVL